MLWRWLFILSLLGNWALGQEIEIIPCQTSEISGELPICCVKRTDTQFILYKGTEELKRFTYSNGPFIITIDPAHDRTLKIALETLLALREAGACR
jgi:hypothetical protein